MFLLLHNYNDVLEAVKEKEVAVLLKETGMSILITCKFILKRYYNQIYLYSHQQHSCLYNWVYFTNTSTSVILWTGWTFSSQKYFKFSIDRHFINIQRSLYYNALSGIYCPRFEEKKGWLS